MSEETMTFRCLLYTSPEMSGEARRGKIIQALKNSDKAVSATTLAKEFDVSRQVIVQDVALLRANGKNIFSTNRGYLIQEDEETTRVFKVQHEDDELSLIHIYSVRHVCRIKLTRFR